MLIVLSHVLYTSHYVVRVEWRNQGHAFDFGVGWGGGTLNVAALKTEKPI